MKRLILAASILTIVPLLIARGLPVEEPQAPVSALGPATRIVLLFESSSL